MLSAIRERLERGRGEGGFTLIELMVVVLIIAILIAIAIPTFLGARKRAQDKQAQSNIRIALATEETVYTDSQVYVDDSATLKAEEGSLNWVDDSPEAAERDVYVEALLPDATAAQGVVLRSWSASGTLFCLIDIQSDLAAASSYGPQYAGTYYGKLTPATSASTCSGVPFGSSW